MREIKFKYWNEVSKMMVSDPPLLNGEVTLNQYFVPRGWVWLQFTNLKDRKGNEIYEGDIVYIAIDHHKGNAVVEFHQGGFVYNGVPFHEQAVTGNIGQVLPSYLVTETGVEVIGNIYETPQLLNPTETSAAERLQSPLSPSTLTPPST